MGNPAVGVKLRIRREEKDGYEKTSANTGRNYWYQFKGGTQGNGDQYLDADDENEAFSIVLRRSKGFELIDFWKDPGKDPENQLEGVRLPNGKSVLVDDACTKPCGDMPYGVIVRDLCDPKAVFVCDPVIRNNPPSL